MKPLTETERTLKTVLQGYSPLAIAVSGGIDSLVLGTLAHRWLEVKPVICHGLSPSVPTEATHRVRSLAAQEGWNLTELPPAEFDDPRYVANPCDRCYFCKGSLFREMRRVTDRVAATGSNLDDLDDYRPGLRAARDHDVVHPFIEAGIDKSSIRELARANGLGDIADLPAAPCLSSRIETGIPITSTDLAFVEQAEKLLVQLLPNAQDRRCRITGKGVVVECAPLPEDGTRVSVEHAIAAACADDGRTFAGLREYRRGSAFIGRR